MKEQSYTQAAKTLRAAGLKVTRLDGEIRVGFPGNESAAYYTDSTNDAVVTGLDMVERARNGATVSDDAEGLAIEAGNHVAGEMFDASEFDAEGEPLDGFDGFDGDDSDAPETVSGLVVCGDALARAFALVSDRCARAVEAVEFFDHFEAETLDGLAYGRAWSGYV
jgi:hypothetical protein